MMSNELLGAKPNMFYLYCTLGVRTMKILVLVKHIIKLMGTDGLQILPMIVNLTTQC